jgi:hypothetical protein
MIADRTYHRLLHVDWISADVDGDGIPESVPQSDQPGRLEPSSTYLLFSTEKSPSRQPGPVPQRFYIGGTTYESWAAVPARYKVEDPLHRDVSRFATPIFKFVF